MADVNIIAERTVVAAEAIEAHKARLEDHLNTTKDAVNSLAGMWKTPNGSVGRTNYALYAAKNFQSFCESIQGYASFLREEVGEGYTVTESSNQDLAEMYK